MIIDVIMPKMGESINEGTILEWRKKVGEAIELDEILLEIGTDKVDSEIPSPSKGVLIEILAQPNDIVEVGKVIAKIDSKNEYNKNLIDKNALFKKSETNLDIKKENKDSIIKIKPISKHEGKNKFYSPVVMKIVTEKKIPLNELEKVLGTGKGGRVTKKDILEYIGNRNSNELGENIKKIKDEEEKLFIKHKNIKNYQAKFSLNEQVEKMSHMRKLISNHMQDSIKTSAHVYLMTEIDMTSIVNFIKINSNSFFDKEGFHLTYTPFILLNTIKALKEYPLMNSSLIEDAIHYHKNINIGLAVSVNDGLMVPSIFNCEEKSFLGICRSVNDVATRTRSKTINPEELSGSTFSITNFGIFGITAGTPIINQPNVGILGIGAIKKTPVVLDSNDGDDSIAIRSVMIVSLGFDHRLIDGSGGAKFLKMVQENIENMNLKDLI